MTTVSDGKPRESTERSPRANPKPHFPNSAGHESNASLLTLIRGRLPSLKRAQRRVADILLEDPEQFITRSISECAKACGTSQGSIVAFCKFLGLRGFPALKIRLARELEGPIFPSSNQARQGQQKAPSVLQRAFEEHIKWLHQTLELNTSNAVHAAARSLLNAKRIVLFSIGLSYPVAYSLYARLRFMGLPAFIEFDSHMQLAAAAEMKRSEVAVGVSVSGSTSETVECLRLSSTRGARTICITNSVGSPLAQATDIRLYAAPSDVMYIQAPLASRVTQLALADALLKIIAMQRKQHALAHLRRAEEHLLKRRLKTGRTL